MALIVRRPSSRGIRRFSEVTLAHLNTYVADVRDSDVSYDLREDLLAAVTRAWTMRHLLPETDRLPEAPPWGGERVRDVLEGGRYRGENRTPRIHPDTMTALLSWSLRFVDDFAEDIIAAFHEHKALGSHLPGRRHTQPGPRRPRNTLTDDVVRVLERYRARGMGVPGQRLPDGTIKVNYYHLGRLTGGQPTARVHGAVVAASGLPVDDDSYLFTPVRGSSTGGPGGTGRSRSTRRRCSRGT